MGREAAGRFAVKLARASRQARARTVHNKINNECTCIYIHAAFVFYMYNSIDTKRELVSTRLVSMIIACNSCYVYMFILKQK